MLETSDYKSDFLCYHLGTLMANLFSIFLVIVTLITGIIWTLDRFRWKKERFAKLEQVQSQAETPLDQKTVEKITAQPSWVENTASIFPVIAFVLVLRSFIFEPFQIPSGSMMPTLLVGDFIAVEKYAYGIKDPVFQTTLVETGHPKRGDIVVFKYPLNPSIDYIKRTVGLPGDTVRYDPQNKQISLKRAGENNFEVVAQTQETESPFLQDGVAQLAYQEQLGDVSHAILKTTTRYDMVEQYQPRPGQNEWVVPQGHYFMMGDNRDNSADSRFWGFVPEENLVGKAVAIWISFEFERDASSILPSWIPTGVRFNRIGGLT